MKNIKKIAITIFKISISLLLLYFVFRKVPFAEVWELTKSSNVLYLILALIAFVGSQWFSSQRLLGYFHANSFRLQSMSNWKLYLVGMFYNFFIPGGIGGDAYKVFLLNKKFGWNVKKLSTSVFCDRLSGLLAIVILIEILSLAFLPGWWKALVFPAIIVTFFVAQFLFNKLFSSFKSIFFKSLLYSFGVQILQLVSIFLILNSFASVEDIWIYFMVFLVSAVLSVISFSGIGVREWLFLKAAQFYTFDAGISVSTAMLFSFITALVSLVGIGFQLSRFELKKEEDV